MSAGEVNLILLIGNRNRIRLESTRTNRADHAGNHNKRHQERFYSFHINTPFLGSYTIFAEMILSQ